VKTVNDLKWTTEIVTNPLNGSRKFTPEINTGTWFERTEEILLGSPNESGTTLLGFIVFIDDTNLTKRGTQSAKPIVMTLANLPERIRNSPVRAMHLVSCGGCLNFVCLLTLAITNA
jgi:hypothetical protein